ncbi:MAG: hypothetical protein JO161_00285 [Planctomycetaceae bacterium]|nr:hypothetical protein [Planctomycetaceae bacterium]
MLQRYRSTGSLKPKPPGGGHPAALGPQDIKRLPEWVAKQPDAMLDELPARLGLVWSPMAICRALQKRGLARQKKVLHAPAQDHPKVQRKRRQFRTEVAGPDRQRLMFVDQTTALTAMTRIYGRAPVGQRVSGAVPGHGGRSRSSGDCGRRG